MTIPPVKNLIPWISIQDQYPPEKTDLLVFCREKHTLFDERNIIPLNWYSIANFEGDFSPAFKDLVTHWCVLNPPKTKEE